MSGYLLEPSADRALDEIADYTRRTWGDRQAADYIDALFAEFELIASRAVPWRPIPPAFGVSGYRRRFRRHFIYWRRTGDGGIAIIAVLHERMEQVLRVGEARR